MRQRWKESLYAVYKALKEQAEKGEKEVTLLKLSALSGYSPVYLRQYLIPVLVQAFECIKYRRGVVVYECRE
ncbi:MAG: hypothetical protein QXT64_02330 [Desulfurococcaceae archaeon]